MATFERARDLYRAHILAAISDLEETRPFAAVTLACCAVDLLAHTLHSPQGKREREDAFKKTVYKKLDGYKNEAFLDRLYALRCGLVHEFRTLGNYSGDVYLTAGLGASQLIGDRLHLDVGHFCGAARQAFERFFISADDKQRRAFTSRAFIHVIEPAPCMSSGTAASILDGLNTFTPPASGSGGPPPTDLRWSNFDDC